MGAFAVTAFRRIASSGAALIPLKAPRAALFQNRNEHHSKMTIGGSKCLDHECPRHLDEAALARAAEFTGEEIATHRLTFDALPHSLQLLISALGWSTAAVDTFAAMTAGQLDAFSQAVALWQAAHDLEPDGMPGRMTRAAMASTGVAERFNRAGIVSESRYLPGADSTIALARAACEVLGLPEQVASSDGLHNIMRRESGGYVGRPNYTIHLDGVKMSGLSKIDEWPKVWARLRSGDVGEFWPEGVSHSTACGLGQLLSSNMTRLGPTGVDGYGDALAEMCALISYVLARYRAPGASAVEAFEDAWRFYTLPRFSGPKSARPKWCRYSWRALKKYGGGNQKPGEGY